MAFELTARDKIKKIQALGEEGRSHLSISKELKCSRATVKKYLARLPKGTIKPKYINDLGEKSPFRKERYNSPDWDKDSDNARKWITEQLESKLAFTFFQLTPDKIADMGDTALLSTLRLLVGEWTKLNVDERPTMELRIVGISGAEIASLDTPIIDVENLATREELSQQYSKTALKL